MTQPDIESAPDTDTGGMTAEKAHLIDRPAYATWRSCDRSSVQVKWYVRAWESPYVLHPVSQKLSLGDL